MCQPFTGTVVQPSRQILKRKQTNQARFFAEIDTFMIIKLTSPSTSNDNTIARIIRTMFFLQRSYVSVSN